MKKAIVVILGMHRSGTSALTRVLNLTGLDLGDELVPAEADNPKGFWEDARIVAIHERFLHAIGRDSADPRVIPAALWDSTAAQDARTELLQALVAAYDCGKALWGVKDPRMCRLLPLWAPLYRQVGRTPRFLLTVRNPFEVAGSLSARERLPMHRGLILWLVSNLDAITHTRGESRVIVSFDQLLTDWDSVVGKIRSGLDVPWTAESEDIRASITAFLDPQLRHHNTRVPVTPAGNAPAVDSDLLEHWVARVYALLQEAALDPHSALDPDIDAIAEHVNRRLLDLERLSGADEAPHHYRWFARQTAWDFIQRAHQSVGAMMPGLRIPVNSLLGPCYKTRNLLARARKAFP